MWGVCFTLSGKIKMNKYKLKNACYRSCMNIHVFRQEFSAATPPSVHDAVSSNIEEQAPPLPLSSAPKVMSHQTGVNGQAEETVEIVSSVQIPQRWDWIYKKLFIY